MGAPFLSQDDSRQSTCQVSPATRTVERTSTVTRSSCARRNGSFSGFCTNAESMRPPRGVKTVYASSQLRFKMARSEEISRVSSMKRRRW